MNPANGTKPNAKQLMLENQKLKGYINQILAENQQLRNTWALNRANFLFKAIELKDFSAEIKEKSIAELEGFLFPKPQEQQAGDGNRGCLGHSGPGHRGRPLLFDGNRPALCQEYL